MNNTLIAKTLLFSMVMTMMMFILMYMMNKSPHPMIMLSLIMMFTLMSCILLSKWKTYPWMPYLLFMVIIGGTLIIFMYLVSLTNKDLFNVKTSMENKLMTTIVSMMTLILVMAMYSDMTSMFNFTLEEYCSILNSSMMKKLNNLNEMKSNNLEFANMESIYSNNSKLTSLCIMLLLLMLILVIKMCSKQNAPLRQIKK